MKEKIYVHKNSFSTFDNAFYYITLNAQGHPVSTGGFGHSECSPEATAIGKALPIDFPVGPTPAP
ncbi:MAG TPA: hypothetical protein VNM22_04975 [Candidatus Limnocylindrales bacterium]|nr:hypothetical protein [Candidatus Limnocylindrales bacterium]